MNLTNDQKKIDLVARLVKEGAIDFNEAVMLLEVEKDEAAWKDDPNMFKIPDFRWPWPMPPLYGPYQITCGTSTGDFIEVLNKTTSRLFSQTTTILNN